MPFFRDRSFEFFVWHLEDDNIKANTIASYKCALTKPLWIGYITVTSEWFSDDESILW